MTCHIPLYPPLLCTIASIHPTNTEGFCTRHWRQHRISAQYPTLQLSRDTIKKSPLCFLKGFSTLSLPKSCLLQTLVFLQLLNEIFRKTREMFQVVRIPLLKTRFDLPRSATRPGSSQPLSVGRSERKKVVNKDGNDGNSRRQKESAALGRPAPSSGCPTRRLHSPGHLLALPGCCCCCC